MSSPSPAVKNKKRVKNTKSFSKARGMKCNVLGGVVLWGKSTFIILLLEMGNEK